MKDREYYRSRLEQMPEWLIPHYQNDVMTCHMVKRWAMSEAPLEELIAELAKRALEDREVIREELFKSKCKEAPQPVQIDGRWYVPKTHTPL